MLRYKMAALQNTSASPWKTLIFLKKIDSFGGNRLEQRSGPTYVGPDLGSSLFASLNKNLVTVYDKCPQMRTTFERMDKRTDRRTNGRMDGQFDFIMPQILFGGHKNATLQKSKCTSMGYWFEKTVDSWYLELGYLEFCETLGRWGLFYKSKSPEVQIHFYII